MNIELRCPEDLEVLKQRQRQEGNAKQRDRYRTVLLALDEKTAPEIAAKLDRSRRFVQQWTYRYCDGGLANLTERPRCGAATKLRLQAPPESTRRRKPEDWKSWTNSHNNWYINWGQAIEPFHPPSFHGTSYDGHAGR